MIAIAASLDKEAQSRTGAGATAIIYRTDDSCGLGENSPEPSASENRRKCGSGLTGQVGRAALVGWSCGRPFALLQQKQGDQLVLWWGFLLVGAVLKCFKSNSVPFPRGKQKGVQVSRRGLLSGWARAAPATSQRTRAGNLRQNLVAEAPNLL